MNFFEVIFLFFAFQALLLAAYFIGKKKGDRTAHIILSVFLLLFAINLVYNVLYWSGLMMKLENIWVFGYLALIWVLYPSLFFLYCKRVMTKKKISLKDAIHTWPFLLTAWAFLPLLRLSSVEKLEVIETGRTGDFIHFPAYVQWAVIVIMVFYTVLTYFSFRHLNVGRNRNRWFLWVLAAFSCYVAAMLTYFVLSHLGLISKSYDYFITYAIIFFIGSLSYFGIMQPDVFEGLSMDSVLRFKKYRKTGLSENHSLELKSQLLDYFEDFKPYLNNQLRLGDLAKELNLSVHHTSQVINEHFDSNFFDFVNRFRIEEAKRLLEEGMDSSISDIIFSSGFNNRVSFYKAFKKHTGMTPTEYKRSK